MSQRPLPAALWSDEVLRVYRHNLTFAALGEPQRPARPLTRRERRRLVWLSIRYRLRARRERLGELVAGRRFDDG